MGNSLENQFIMRGEFRGDFTRDTFFAGHHFSRVLMQQGRVQLDADWNEQVSIMTHYLRNLASDLIGPHGAPADIDGNPGEGFKVINVQSKDFEISPGHYYVNGVLCENAGTEGILISEKGNNLLVYLDVWERHMSRVEEGGIREVALGGPDTATRAKIEAQVKLQKITAANIEKLKQGKYSEFLKLLKETRVPGKLCARARKAKEGDTEPCLIAPESRYRGLENQLYRVEIHQDNKEIGVTFKWSRENGSVIFPIDHWVSDKVISLEHLGRDSRYGLKPNDWIELYDDTYALQGNAHPLMQIESVDHDKLEVTLTQDSTSNVGKNLIDHPYLRRWDHGGNNPNGLPMEEGADADGWHDLEDGIQIQFKESNGSKRPFVTGDYWLIPARTITGDVEWPSTEDVPEFLSPHGIAHYYAPLASLTRTSTTQNFTPNDLRRHIKPLWK